MKKLVLPIFFILLSSIIYADTPGKRSMGDSKIFLKNIAVVKDYNFYWKLDNDSALVINTDTTLTIPGSGGKPYSAMLWAVNKKTNDVTDTIFFDNYYSPDYAINIDSIYNNKLLIYTKKETGNNNAGGDGLSINADDRHSGKMTKITFLSAASLIALILLVWFFIKRKVKEKNIYGTGS